MNLDNIVASLAAVSGVRAIALGGSRSRGEADQHSDYEIGLYYEAGLLDLQGLSEVLRSLDDGHREEILNPPGAWGPWINGGAWITVDGTPAVTQETFRQRPNPSGLIGLWAR